MSSYLLQKRSMALPPISEIVAEQKSGLEAVKKELMAREKYTDEDVVEVIAKHLLRTHAHLINYPCYHIIKGKLYPGILRSCVAGGYYDNDDTPDCVHVGLKTGISFSLMKYIDTEHWSGFVNAWTSVAVHELTHYEQIHRIDGKTPEGRARVYKSIDENYVTPEKAGHEAYLFQPIEMAANARSSVSEWHAEGLTDEEITGALKQHRWGDLAHLSPTFAMYSSYQSTPNFLAPARPPVQEGKLRPFLEQIMRVLRGNHLEGKSMQASLPQKTAAPANGVPGELNRLKVESTIYDSYRDEHFGWVRAWLDDQQVGYINFSIYKDWEIATDDGHKPAEVIHLKMIETERGMRRKGIATKMIEKLRADNPGCLLNWGGTTPEGSKLKKHLDSKKMKSAFLRSAGEQVRFLYHGTSSNNLKSIFSEGGDWGTLGGPCYWGSEDIAYSFGGESCAERQGHTVLIKAPLSAFNVNRLEPDHNMIAEPDCITLNSSSQQLYAKWKACAGTWQDSLRIYGAVRYPAAVRVHKDWLEDSYE